MSPVYADPRDPDRLITVSDAVLPLNDATVDALCEKVRDLDAPFGPDWSLVPGPKSPAFARRVAIQQTLNELAPDPELAPDKGMA